MVVILKKLFLFEITNRAPKGLVSIIAAFDLGQSRVIAQLDQETVSDSSPTAAAVGIIKHFLIHNAATQHWFRHTKLSFLT
jgi:hypothetical protein